MGSLNGGQCAAQSGVGEKDGDLAGQIPLLAGDSEKEVASAGFQLEIEIFFFNHDGPSKRRITDALNFQLVTSR